MEEIVIIQSALLIIAIITILLNIKLKFFKFKVNSYFFDIAVPALIAMGLLLINISNIMSLYRDILIVYLAPITEEIFFRGFLIGAPLLILKKYKIKEEKLTFLLIIFSSFIFTILHGDYSYSRMIFGLTMGIMFVLYKNNLLPCVIAHFVNNAILIFSMN